MKEQDTDTPAKFLGIPLSEAILLAVAPVIAYVLAFVYQAGYCDAFGIPLQFITLNVVDVLSTGSKILVAVALIFGLLNFLSSLLPSKTPSPLRRRVLQALPLFLLIVPSLLFYEWRTEAVILSILMALVVLTMFLPPLFARRYKGSYLQRMEALDSRASSSNPWEGSLLNLAVDAAGFKIFMAAIYFLLGVYLAYNAGKASALKQKVFLVDNTSPDAVVLFMTSERLISAPVDKITKRIEPVFTIVNIAEATLTLRPVEIGPLKLHRSTGAQPRASSERLRRR